MPAMVPIVAGGLSQDTRKAQPSPSALKLPNQAARRRQCALVRDSAKASLRSECRALQTLFAAGRPAP
jgi:hypothetical protein